MNQTRTLELKLSDLPLSTARRVLVDGAAVAVVRTPDGVFAVDDVCSHAEVSLSEGEVDGCTLECWLHGSRFDLRTGEPSGPPAFEPIKTYHVTIEGTGDDAIVTVALAN